MNDAMKSLKVRARGGVGVFAVAAVTGAVAMAGIGAAHAATSTGEPGAQAPTYVPGRALVTAGDFTPSATERFAALSAPRSAVPAALRAIVPNGGGLGANLDQARTIETAGGTAYVFPVAKDGVCIASLSWDPKSGPVDGDWGIGCTAYATTSERGVFVNDVDDEGRGIGTLLVPRGATVAKVSRGDSSSVGVRDGVASARLAAGEVLVLR